MIRQEKEPSTPTSTSSEGVREPQHDVTSQTPLSRFAKAWRYLNENIRPSGLVEAELLILTFCIGLQDAVSFPDFHCFASNQTGNTVFLILAIVLPEMNGEMFITANIGVALGFFLAAAWLTGQLGHVVGPRRRLWVIACNLLQTGLVFGAAAVQYSQPQHDGAPPLDGVRSPRTLYAIGLLATAAGSQVVQSRAFRMTEITTAMATAAWVDLLIDCELLRLRNRPRNRRIAFLAMLLLGTLSGAFIFKRLGSPPALVVSGAGKLLVTGMYFFNGAEKEKAPNAGNPV
ncbi:hypothetical protein BT67DRAFT_450924 [Trichocladium antarcticum]|uniref:DUF1275 domain protein n=1 Tax=Trichocladium antarcticum TaxID=1450529 RepID=A0AAN6UGS1_9PEZI|nr:hypothetical protein BT67DRAFT_450924 [Trichocladium antarcticum]